MFSQDVDRIFSYNTRQTVRIPKERALGVIWAGSRLLGFLYYLFQAVVIALFIYAMVA